MYSYSLKYLCQLDNSTRHHSNKISCTGFRKDLSCDFARFSHFILCMGLIYAETCCVSKFIDVDATTAFVSHKSD